MIKLKSGYNTGLKAEHVKRIKIVESQLPAPRVQNTSSTVPNDGGKNLLLLSTGGTIASRVDYRTGAVYPALSAQDLYLTIPELDEIAKIKPHVVFSIYSENIGPKEWQTLSEKIVAYSKEESPDGIVVMIGTDTLAYVAAALSFSTIGLKPPVVLVGAQRSTDRPSSDGALNLKAAATFAVDSEISGVFVAMHENENDDSIAIHTGSRVRKNHTSRRDAFESIDVPLFGRVRGNQIVKTPGNQQKQQRSNE
ncbi:MAG: asparaginase, partial [Nitrososphaerota archaeon]|nr:asparaginase [Nitrososphaerota archaeon]